MATIQIEVSNRWNAAIHFKPTNERVRGAIDFAAPGFAEIGDPDLYAYGRAFGGKTIPGKRIVIDTERREAVIFDPLALPEHEALFSKLATANADPIRNCETIKPGASKKYANLTQDEVSTWVHHMRRHVEAGHAVVVSGDVTVKVEGTARTEFIHVRREAKDKRDDTIERLTALVTAQSDQIAKLLGAKK